ncbi:MAG: S8 family serine peptidase [Calditrichaeota bacterium]|nr:S8 family serine peptidase [Calditrichota bacterium]
MKHSFTVLIVVVAFFTYNLQADTGTSDLSYLPGRVIVKFTSEFNPDLIALENGLTGISHIDVLFGQVSVTRAERTYPHCLPPLPGGTDLTRIFTIYFPESHSPQNISDDLENLTGIEYAEPWYVSHIFLDHNDPQRGDQYGLDLVDANDAHDLSTGDLSALVAIVDNGVDLDHEDLEANLWVNPGEDLNGDGVINNNEANNRDDDDNGFVDDFYGWDFENDDNDPDDRHGHGTHCAGIASAVTNNQTGISSVGYSCGIIAIRAGSGLTISYGYPGIEYAVRAGAKVISCSWGSDRHNRQAQDVINYAWENDVMVIAAAGNDGNDDLRYPAAYEHVIAVAATNENDRKAAYSSYGEWVDISAPGDEILSTKHRDRYITMSGTSMACPFAASVAILIRSTYSWMDVDEAANCLLEGAEDIDDINDRYRGRLGTGRINAYNSMLIGLRPVLTIESVDIINDGNENGAFDPGEQVELSVYLSNHPDAETAESIIVRLSSNDPAYQIQNAILEFPDLEPGEGFVNLEDPFIIDIEAETIPHTASLKVSVEVDHGVISIVNDYEFIIGHPAVLIVDDDKGEDAEKYYYSAVETMDLGWVHWDVETDFAPDGEILADYEMVIWTTGNTEEPLDDLDLWQIESGFFEGANILLIGNHIGDDEINRQLLNDYFGAEHDEDSVSEYYSQVREFSDNHFLHDIVLDLQSEDAADYGNISPSSMIPVNGGDSLLIYYDEFSEEYGGVASVYRYDQRQESKTVYMGFAFEGTGSGDNPRSEALAQIYEWFISEYDNVNPEQTQAILEKFELGVAYPNPFNSSVRVDFRLPVGSRYMLMVHDISGREVEIIGQGVGNAGLNTAVWNGGDIPSGVYLLRLSTPGVLPLEKRLVLVK